MKTRKPNAATKEFLRYYKNLNFNHRHEDKTYGIPGLSTIRTCMRTTGPTSRAVSTAVARAIALLLLLFITLTLQGQEIKRNSDGSVDLHFKNEAQWEAHKQKILFLDKDNKTADSLINYIYRPEITKLEKKVSWYDSTLKNSKALEQNYINQITMLQADLIEQGTKRAPIFEWIGFYAGASTGYAFADSVINKETIVNSLWNNLSFTGQAVIRFRDFLITPGITIPMQRKPSINLNVGYRLF